MELYVIKPYGCCSGVVNAINIAKNVKKISDGPVYILGMLVHNEQIVNELATLGIKTLVDSNKTPKQIIESIDDGTLIFTAHGHDPKLEEIAINRGLKVFDATCPYVKSNQELIKTALNNGKQVIFVGQSHHPECEGCLSLGDDVILYDIKGGIDYDKVYDDSPYVITQTTLSVLELETIYKDIDSHIPNASLKHEVCGSTRIRQTELLNAPSDSDVFFIIGSSLSSNTRKLYEIATSSFPDADVFFIHNFDELTKLDLSKYKKAVVAAGASTPIETVDQIIEYLKSLK